ncbi:Haloacid dehalogenase-like hydrolase superfamily protein [Prunus dulcis]|uniref:Haloacid dehalogenase-like hydrolase superfamily protein n=1 Tax=Prunus dulcis TaxID=3755 RepID=A0A4Y1QNL8_PRUDU|nr:Haloacid dehalogenase-like hydrolase superfamily protein [Prunus dulcis]
MQLVPIQARLLYRKFTFT